MVEYVGNQPTTCESYGEIENVQVPYTSSEVNSARLFHRSSESTKYK